MTDLRDQLQATLGGTYVLERELGGGGMSRVFVADEVRLGRKVVVKVLSPELAAGLSAERFEREIRLAASLQQANIVPVLTAGDSGGLPCTGEPPCSPAHCVHGGSHGGLPYFTMPLVTGESLRARLGRGPLPVAEVTGVLRDVAKALAFAHAQGVVHRDIKPDNVLLSGGTAVVTDFGIAKAIAAARAEGRSSGATLTSIGTSLGTPAYIAPEQAAGDPDTDHRADLYAFGCMAFELLAGRPPFVVKSPQRLLAAHLGETPPDVRELRPDTPPALAELVMRCLKKDPAERPQHAAEMLPVLDGATASSSDALPTMPTILLGGRGMLTRALAVYAGSFVGVAILAKAAIVGIGLPDWVFPGALIVMALGLPVILFTAYVHHVTHRAVTRTPTLTPGGSVALPPQGTMATMALRASPHVSWRRATHGGLYALGAFVTLVAAFMVLRSLGIGPVGSLLAAGKLQRRDPLLVADFGVRGADSSVASVVGEAVRTNLGQSASITLVGPARIADALRRMQRPPTSRVDLQLARQIAAREGIRAIVDGDVTALGGGFVVALRLVSADSGNVLASFQQTVDRPSELVAGVDAVVRKLRGKIGESLKDVHASPPLEQVTTASLDALRAYSIGTRANDTERDYSKAVTYLRQAVAIDTGFAMAWRKLGVALGNMGARQSARDSALSRAYQMRARLTENERLLTEAYYFSSGPGHDRARAIASYEQLLARGDSSYTNNLALLYASRRDFARAESLYRVSIRVRPEVVLAYGNIIPALWNQGKRAETQATIARTLERFPTNAGAQEQRMALQFYDGKVDDAFRVADSLTRAGRGELRSWSTGLAGGIALMRGQLGEWQRRRAQGAVIDSGMGNPHNPLADSIAAAELDAWLRDQPQRAVQRLDAALAAHPLEPMPEADRPELAAARLYALGGRPDRARALVALVNQMKDTALRRAQEPSVHAVLAEIALAEKRPRDAVTEFRKADRLPDGPAGSDPVPLYLNLGRAFDAAEQPDSAIASFEQYLATPNWARGPVDTYFLAGVHRRLGELYEARGDRARAASHYQAFVDLWKDADPELRPRVDEVRRRLAHLRDTERTR